MKPSKPSTITYHGRELRLKNYDNFFAHMAQPDKRPGMFASDMKEITINEYILLRNMYWKHYALGHPSMMWNSVPVSLEEVKKILDYFEEC